uniref:KRAB domain-containing protein n=1 Tax=Rousettus aegyptiacus TaxID=9407 RepID=A0A7J8CNQ0_ROUAE|nr:hypothetical protein HJG63_021260 [Rousettus aegyptiacus]
MLESYWNLLFLGISVSDLYIVSILEQGKAPWIQESKLNIAQKPDWWEHIEGVNAGKSSGRERGGLSLHSVCRLTRSEKVLWANRILFLGKHQRKFFFYPTYYSVL